ncbi:MAG: sporulation protein [Bacillota bacterium]|nr:sporulation protein [Bacillota bacterium]
MIEDKRERRFLYFFITFFLVLLLSAGLALYSKETMSAARSSIHMCLDVVVPSLFPFLTVSSLFIELGLASFVGSALNGAMHRLFGVSGACAPAFALGLIGGYPVGVKTAVSLYEKKLCTKEETERLLAFCNNSGPAFILGAVGAGVFASSACGFLLYITHALSAVTVGAVFRLFYGKISFRKIAEPRSEFYVRDFPQVFIASVKSGFGAVLNISAFVIFFSVFIELLSVSYVLNFISGALFFLFSPLGVSLSDCLRLSTGFFELTSGVMSLSASGAPLASKLAMAAFMLGFAGVSVHFQALSFMAGTGLKKTPYFAGKLLQGFLAALYTYFLSTLLSISVPASVSLTFAAGRLFKLKLLSVSLLALWVLINLLNLHFQKRPR